MTRKETSRFLRNWCLLALLVLGGLSVSPVWSEDAPQKPEPDALEKARAELKKLVEEVSKKRAEVRELELRKKDQVSAPGQNPITGSYRQLLIEINQAILERKYKNPEGLQRLREFRDGIEKAGDKFLEEEQALTDRPGAAKSLSEQSTAEGKGREEEIGSKKDQTSAKARYELAESYLEQATANGNPKPRYELEEFLRLQENYRLRLQKAADEFLELDALIENNPEAARQLSEEERRLVSLHAADCSFQLGKYDETLKLYNRLAKRFDNSLERLHALAGAVRCLAASRKFDEMQKRLEEIREGIEGVDEQQREDWRSWLRIVQRVLPK